jgi:hypothetical protein
MMMTSFLQMALEGELGTLDTGSGQPEAHEEGQKELMVLKGPLAEQFSQALAQMYNKNKPVEQQEEAAVEGVATESQANDALSLADLAEDVQILGEEDVQDGATTVYGVDEADVKPEDVVEVSQEITEFDPENPDFVLVMNGDPATESVNEYAKALEAMCDRAGVQIFPSLEAFAEKRKEVKDKVKALKFGKGQAKLTEGHAAGDEGQGLDFCDPDVLGVVVKMAQDKFDVNLGADSEFFPAGEKITKLKAEKMKEFIGEIELHFKGKKITKEAGDKITTPKQLAAYFSQSHDKATALKFAGKKK